MKRLIALSLFLCFICHSLLFSQDIKKEKVKLKFTVYVPPNTPSAVYIAGIFNDWNPGKDTLAKIGDRLYSYELEADKGAELQYKYTCGDWQSVESNIDTFDIDNRELLADINKTVYDTVYTWRTDFRDSSAVYIIKEDGPIEFAKARHDAEFFFKTLQEVHPNLLASISVWDYMNLRKHVFDTLKSLSDKGKLRRCRLALEIAKAAAFFKDAHTSSWSLQDMINSADSSNALPPFRLERIEGKFYIASASAEWEKLAGSELLKINGEDVAGFIKPALAFLSGERDSYRINKFIRRQQEAWHITGLLKNNFTVSVKDNNGAVKELAMSPVSAKDFEALPKKEIKYGENVTFEFYDNDAICYFRYNSFDYSEDEKRKIDSMFAQVKERGTKTFIMDLRYNGGGNSGMGDYILSYLTDKPYMQFSAIEMKISKPIMKRMFTNSYRGFEGLTETYRHKPELPPDRGFKFKGSYILLTSESTFSSAADFASVIKDYKIGTIIGEETGGNRACFGDVQNFYTPNYRVQFACSFKKFYAPIPQPDDLERGTLPDVPVTKEIMDKYKAEKDPVLSFALDYAGEKK